jgi:hypothetical protein
MIGVGKSIIAVEPNHGEVVRVNPSTGAISRIIDISATQGHIVPTVIVRRGDAFYLSNLGVFPIVPGLEKVFRLSPSGALTVVADGFTTVLGLDFDRAGRLYVLESFQRGRVPHAGHRARDPSRSTGQSCRSGRWSLSARPGSGSVLTACCTSPTRDLVRLSPARFFGPNVQN